MLMHYSVKQQRCSKLLHYMVIISIRLLACALSIPQRTPWDLIICGIKHFTLKTAHNKMIDELKTHFIQE